MTIYVDPIFNAGKRWTRGNTESCHMGATDGDLGELQAFAAKIGLKSEWLQWHRGLFVVPHFDLTPSRRRVALEQGAVEVEATELLVLCHQPKEATNDRRNPKV